MLGNARSVTSRRHGPGSPKRVGRVVERLHVHRWTYLLLYLVKTSLLWSYREVKLLHNTFPLMYSAGGTGVEDWDECTDDLCSSRPGK